MAKREENKYRLKRHEGFYLREGWVEKAINALKDGKLAFSKAEGVKTLGIGSNMVKSLRFWLIASGIISDTTGELTEMGRAILECDPYLDDLFSWWMVHINLASNYKEAPVFNILFNAPKLKNFNQEALTKVILTTMEEREIDMANSGMAKDDVSVFVRSYVEQVSDDPEDNMVCPLSRLSLMKEVKKGLNFLSASYKKLPMMAVYYAIAKVMENEETDSINIDDLISANNSPVKIMNLDKNLLYTYLNDLSRAGLLTINRTAGLNMIYLQGKLTAEQIVRQYFEGGSL